MLVNRFKIRVEIPMKLDINECIYANESSADIFLNRFKNHGLDIHYFMYPKNKHRYIMPSNS